MPWFLASQAWEKGKEVDRATEPGSPWGSLLWSCRGVVGRGLPVGLKGKADVQCAKVLTNTDIPRLEFLHNRNGPDCSFLANVH